MKKILVIGASGFVGGHIAQALLADGYQVCCLARRYLLTASRELAQVVYNPYLPEDRNYKVYGWWTKDKTAATNASIKITGAGEIKTITANQRTSGDGWVLPGTYRFEKGQKGYITVSNENADGTVMVATFKVELMK